ncbi:hypothetical protein ACJJTC_006174 [Scirpophaga incertulas]
MASVWYIPLLLAAAAPSLADIPMKFKKYPQSVAAPVGDEVAFECAVNVPGDRLAWRWRPVDKSAHWRELNGTTDKTSTTLIVTVKEDTPTSLYQCVVWYGAISLVSLPARLSVARLDVSNLRASTRVVSASPHNTVVLHCQEPLSEPPAVITWWKERAGSKISILSQETPHGALVIQNATADDSGVYGCSATNEPSGKTVDLPEKVHLKIERGKHGDLKFLETEDYVGHVDKDGALTVRVRPQEPLRLWCGAVGSPVPRVVWTRQGGRNATRWRQNNHTLVIDPFLPDDEGVYTCSAGGLRRSWKVVALQAPRWEGASTGCNATEGGDASISCGQPRGSPLPTVSWLINSEPVHSSKTNHTIPERQLYLRSVQKRHAGVVQCFACNELGCAYDAAYLTVVPVQIADDLDYSAELPKTQHFAMQSPKRHSRKNQKGRKQKGIAKMVPPSKPTVTRLSESRVMVFWTHPNHGLPIQFYKVQYREMSNMNDKSWQTFTLDILPHIHACEVDTLHPNAYYKFRIAAVYSNQDNNQGNSSARFYLHHNVSAVPHAPEITSVKPVSPHAVQLNWTWSSGTDGIQTDGFYAYFRTVTSAGPYDKAAVPNSHARSTTLSHLNPDTAYEVKIRAFTTQAASEFSSLEVVKTERLMTALTTTTEAAVEDQPAARAPDALVTAGGALGAAGLLALLAAALLLCRRRRPPPDTGGALGAAGLLALLAAALLLCRRRRPPPDSEYHAQRAGRWARRGCWRCWPPRCCCAAAAARRPTVSTTHSGRGAGRGGAAGAAGRRAAAVPPPPPAARHEYHAQRAGRWARRGCWRCWPPRCCCAAAAARRPTVSTTHSGRGAGRGGAAGAAGRRAAAVPPPPAAARHEYHAQRAGRWARRGCWRCWPPRCCCAAAAARRPTVSTTHSGRGAGRGGAAGAAGRRAAAVPPPPPAARHEYHAQRAGRWARRGCWRCWPPRCCCAAAAGRRPTVSTTHSGRGAGRGGAAGAAGRRAAAVPPPPPAARHEYHAQRAGRWARRGCWRCWPPRCCCAAAAGRRPTVSTTHSGRGAGRGGAAGAAGRRAAAVPPPPAAARHEYHAQRAGRWARRGCWRCWPPRCCCAAAAARRPTVSTTHSGRGAGRGGAAGAAGRRAAAVPPPPAAARHEYHAQRAGRWARRGCWRCWPPRCCCAAAAARRPTVSTTHSGRGAGRGGAAGAAGRRAAAVPPPPAAARHEYHAQRAGRWARRGCWRCWPPRCCCAAAAGRRPTVTGGALGAAGLLALLAAALLLCRRRRPPPDKEKVSVPESGGSNGYIQAKLPITITSNPMHGEGGDSSVEMSFLHNNNCGNNGNNDDTLPHTRKNCPSPKQYV